MIRHVRHIYSENGKNNNIGIAKRELCGEEEWEAIGESLGREF